MIVDILCAFGIIYVLYKKFGVVKLAVMLAFIVLYVMYVIHLSKIM